MAYITLPEVRLNFNSILDSESVVRNNYSMTISEISLGTGKRIIFTLSLFLIPILQVYAYCIVYTD